MNYTKHASKRVQQRNIPQLIIDWLWAYGKEIYDHKGGVIYYFDKISIRNIEKSHGTTVVKKLKSLLDTYIVVSSDSRALITVGHNYKRKRLDA